MKKFLSNTIVQLLIAVIIGLSAGFVVNDAVLEAIVCIKHITGQIIFFLSSSYHFRIHRSLHRTLAQ